MSDIFKGLCETVKAEVDGNKASLEAKIEQETRDRVVAIQWHFWKRHLWKIGRKWVQKVQRDISGRNPDWAQILLIKMPQKGTDRFHFGHHDLCPLRIGTGNVTV